MPKLSPIQVDPEPQNIDSTQIPKTLAEYQWSLIYWAHSLPTLSTAMPKEHSTTLQGLEAWGIGCEEFDRVRALTWSKMQLLCAAGITGSCPPTETLACSRSL